MINPLMAAAYREAIRSNRAEAENPERNRQAILRMTGIDSGPIPASVFLRRAEAMQKALES